MKDIIAKKRFLKDSNLLRYVWKFNLLTENKQAVSNIGLYGTNTLL